MSPTRIVILQFSVAAGREAEFEQMVAERAQRHRTASGFQRMYLLRADPQRPEYRMVVWWKDLDAPESFVRKETYALSEDQKHAGIVVGPVPHEVLEVAREF